MTYTRQEDTEALERQVREEKIKRRKKRIKTFFITTAVFWLISATALTVFLKFYLDPLIQQKLEAKGSEILGAPLKIGKASLGFFPTVHLKLSAVQFAMPSSFLTGTTSEAKISLGASAFQLATGGALGVVTVELDEPRIEIQQPAPPPQQAAGPQSPSSQNEDTAPPLVPSLRLSRDIGVRLRIREGHVHLVRQPATELKLERLGLTVDVPNLNSFDGTIALKVANSIVKNEDLTFRFPVDLNSKVKLEGNVVTISDARGDFFGLGFTANGWQNLYSGRADWKLTGHVPELAAVPVSFLPHGKWSGKLSAAINANAVSSEKGWNVQAKIDVSKLKGVTRVEKNGIVADGGVSANASLEVSAEPKADKSYLLSLKKGFIAADISDMAIEKVSLFKKPKGTPLVFYFSGAGNQSAIRIEKFDLKFANLGLRSSGILSFEPGQYSALSAVIDKTDLSGWEAYLPPLANSPVKGFLQMNADLRGDLKKPEAMTIRLNPLLLDNFEAGLKWVSEDKQTQLTGPIKANARIEVSAVGTELRGANLKLDSDLTALHVLKLQTFEKKAGLPLRLNVLGSQKGQQIEIKSSALNLGSSQFNISGRVSNPQRPQLNLRIASPSMNLNELASLSPKASSFGVAGNGNMTVDLSGIYDFKLGIAQSPLKAKADLAIRLPRYKMDRAQTASEPPAGSGPAPSKTPEAPPEALLPDWVIARTAEAKIDVTVAELLYGDLPVRGIRVLSNLDRGDLSGSVQVEQVFEGKLKVPRFRTRLSTPLPDSTADVEFTGINLQQAATFASPDWRELVKGSATGKMRTMVPHPSNKAFVDRFQGSGNLNIKNGFLSTVQLDKMVNENLAKIPGVGNQARVDSKGVTADISANFRAEKRVLHLGQFIFITPEKNELQAQGKIGFDKSVDLNGTGYLATAPVGGSVRSANSDKQGRFVIPLKIQGNLLKPEVAFAQETISQLARKTAEQELKKGVQNKIDQLQDSIKKKGLDGLKDIFK